MKFFYGGQAVIEGVMIRGRKAMVTAVRRPDGQIVLDVQSLSPLYTGRLRRMPLVRGIIVLIEALVLGIKSLLFSASMSLEEEGEEFTERAGWLMIGVAMVFAVVVFFLIPLFLTRLLNAFLSSSILFNIVEGFIRLVIFVVYLKAIGLVKDIKRVFTYHGAEHKAVNAYEAGVPMEVASVRNYGKAHRRCGTSFLFVVMIVAIIVFSLIGRPSLWLMVLSRIVLVPVIAAVGYEVVFFGANHTGNALVRAVLAPGLWLQSLTTREPEDSQLEVSIAAMKKAIELDQTGESPQPTPSA